MKIDKRTAKRRLGDIGENVACVFLEKNGFKIIERNYLRKWGEIDIVAKKGAMIHFVEVKSVSCVTLDNVSHARPTEPSPKDSFWREPFGRGTMGEYRPEDNMHPWKLKRLSRAMQTYLLEKRIDLDWQLDLITVRIDEKNRKARAEILENIII